MRWNSIHCLVIDVYDPSKHGILILVLVALVIISGTTRLLQEEHQLSTFSAHIYDEPFAKSKAITAKKLWTRYTIDHEEQLTWDNEEREFTQVISCKPSLQTLMGPTMGFMGMVDMGLPFRNQCEPHVG